MKKYLKSAIALIVIAIMAMTLFAGCSTTDDEDSDSETSVSASTAKKAVDKYFDLEFSYNFDNIEDLAPDAFWDYIEDEYGVTLKELKNGIKDLEDDLEETKEYLKDYKISFDIVDEYELDEDDFEELCDDINYNYGISSKKIKEAVELEIEINIESKTDEDDTYSDDESFIAVKIDRTWYLVYYDGYFLIEDLVEGIIDEM